MTFEQKTLIQKLSETAKLPDRSQETLTEEEASRLIADLRNSIRISWINSVSVVGFWERRQRFHRFSSEPNCLQPKITCLQNCEWSAARTSSRFRTRRNFL